MVWVGVGVLPPPPKQPWLRRLDGETRPSSRFMQTNYRGPVCIEVEDDTFGKTLEGRERALKVAANVLRPSFA